MNDVARREGINPCRRINPVLAKRRQKMLIERYAARDADKEAAIITVKNGKLTFVETIRP